MSKCVEERVTNELYTGDILRNEAAKKSRVATGKHAHFELLWELAELAVQRWQNHEVLAALHGIEPRHTHQWPRSSSLLPRVSTCSRSGSVPRCRLQVRWPKGSPFSTAAAAPAGTPSAQRVGSASCMSRCRAIGVSCFAAGAGHPAPGLPAEPRQPPHPGKSITCLEKKKDF